MKYKEIADKYNISINTVESWKQRHGWERKKGAPSQKGVHTKKPGAPPGNKNAVGNNGGALLRNNTVTQGFLSRNQETPGLLINAIYNTYDYHVLDYDVLPNDM